MYRVDRAARIVSPTRLSSGHRDSERERKRRGEKKTAWRARERETERRRGRSHQERSGRSFSNRNGRDSPPRFVHRSEISVRGRAAFAHRSEIRAARALLIAETNNRAIRNRIYTSHRDRRAEDEREKMDGRARARPRSEKTTGVCTNESDCSP